MKLDQKYSELVEYSGECPVCNSCNIKTGDNFEKVIGNETVLGYECVCEDCKSKFYPTDQHDNTLTEE